MRDGMIIVKSFTNETEARVALAYLEAMHITAFIEADNCGGMRPHLDLTSGVHLLVKEADCVNAAEILKESENPVIGEAWICSSCNESIEAGFDTCWQCGKEK